MYQVNVDQRTQKADQIDTYTTFPLALVIQPDINGSRTACHSSSPVDGRDIGMFRLSSPIFLNQPSLASPASRSTSAALLSNRIDR